MQFNGGCLRPSGSGTAMSALSTVLATGAGHHTASKVSVAAWVAGCTYYLCTFLTCWAAGILRVQVQKGFQRLVIQPLHCAVRGEDAGKKLIRSCGLCQPA